MTVLLNDLEASSPSVRQDLEDRDSRGRRCGPGFGGGVLRLAQRC
jgi:hypothetical protein